MPRGFFFHNETNDRYLGCNEENNLMNVYRDFGLHQLAPSTEVPTVACGDDRFARGTLYNSTEKDYPHPMRCERESIFFQFQFCFFVLLFFHLTNVECFTLVPITPFTYKGGRHNPITSDICV